jgi:1-acyl-sn-glycerol-3-phosphate acyltransferase
VRRKHPKLGFWLWCGWMISIPPTTALFRRTWRGIDNVPERGPAILALNHLSYVDPLLVIRFVYDCGRIPRFLAKASLFTIFGFRQLLRGARQIPVYRGSAEAGDSLREAEAALRDGDMVTIYPEGTVTRDPDWWPMRPMTGIARLALTTGAPVIPVAQWGAQFSVDWYARRFRPFPRKKVVFQAGPPVDLSAYQGRPVTAALLREVTDVIMRAVRDQLGQVRGEIPPEQFAPRPAPRAERAERGSTGGSAPAGAVAGGSGSTAAPGAAAAPAAAAPAAGSGSAPVAPATGAPAAGAPGGVAPAVVAPAAGAPGGGSGSEDVGPPPAAAVGSAGSGEEAAPAGADREPA